MGECGCDSDDGDGISSIEPCGEFALEMLWLPLDSVSTLELLTERGERGVYRPRFFALALSFARVPPATSPSVSTVIIFCSAANLRVSASSLIASSSSYSLSEFGDQKSITLNVE
ncbi:hypothetical protein CVT25_013631 [Psilocybe cyanescens]|uniref:Uncharacterized protein n=1 Tax=Psilocybe cyanescens TaxID=93625 RepID=A0A409W5P1_PSICY|nr:hypothetical protein CVT25_013631 [Psilocybe cyanescens]